MGRVQAGKALHLVPEAAVLVARLQKLPPHRMESLMVVLQQPAVPVPHLQTQATGNLSVTARSMHREYSGNSSLPKITRSLLTLHQGVGLI